MLPPPPHTTITTTTTPTPTGSPFAKPSKVVGRVDTLDTPLEAPTSECDIEAENINNLVAHKWWSQVRRVCVGGGRGACMTAGWLGVWVTGWVVDTLSEVCAGRAVARLLLLYDGPLPQLDAARQGLVVSACVLHLCVTDHAPG